MLTKAEYAAVLAELEALMAKAPQVGSLNQEGIDVLPLARACRDLNSILRRQRRVLVTRRRIPVVVMEPIGHIEGYSSPAITRGTA